MKKRYVRPTMVGERFVANEYVAACGDTEYGVYKFKCDAGSSSWYNTVYYETNGVAGLQKDSDKLKTRFYYACGEEHEAPTNDEFLDGYCITPKGETLSVVIWTDGGTDVHCTTNLNRDSWETTKS